MATRRDQLQSYQFLLQRVVSALVYRKTDPAQSPFRRAGGAIFAGIMLSALALAITAVIGLFATGCGKTADWKDGVAIIREEETNTLYVILPAKKHLDSGQRQTLYEVANFASAALLAGTTEVFEIKSQSLRENKGVDMGTTVGILGAPNSIPKPEAVSDNEWTLCSFPANDDRENATSKLFVGTEKSKGDDLGNEQAVAVTNGEDTYVVSSGLKHLVENKEEDNEDILRYLTAPDEVRQVDQAFLDGIETGDPLRIPDFGDPSEDSAVDGQKVGTVIKEVGSGTTKYWVATQDGVASITKLQADMIAKKQSQTNIEELPIANETPTDLRPTGDGAPPERITKFAESGLNKPMCAIFPTSGKRPEVLVSADVPNLNGVKTDQSTSSTAYADQIIVAPGTGALAESGTEDAEGGLSLITTSGKLFGIDQSKPDGKTTAAPADAKTALGYNGEEKPKTIHMPTQVLDLIPEGPQLSPIDAMRTVPGGGK